MIIDNDNDDDNDVAGEFQPILAEVGGRAVSDSSFLHWDNQPCYPRTIFDDRSQNIYDYLWWFRMIYDDLGWFVMIYGDLWLFKMIYDNFYYS